VEEPHFSDAEWRVMDALWSLGGAPTAREVLAEVSGRSGWAYNTVKTMLDRLAAKGVLAIERDGRISRFRPRVTRARARRAAARSLLDRAFGGAAGALVHHLVRSETLSPAERDELRRMLDGKDDEGRR
jgi:predicted transcriptional regulator